MDDLLPRIRIFSVVLASAGALIACGGGGGDETPVAKTARERPNAYFAPTNGVPADASVKGMWSSVYNWPLIAVHAVLLPDGRVLTYGSKADGTQGGSFIYDVWDSNGAPDAGHLTLPNGSGTDLFCSSQLVLPPTSPTAAADVFIAGGDVWNTTALRTTNGPNNNSNVFNGTDNSLSRGPNMNRPRWYSSSITLVNGETYIQGGSGGTDFPEIRGTSGTFRLLTGADTGAFDFMYPRNFVAPDGRVFGFDSNGRMYYVVHQRQRLGVAGRAARRAHRQRCQRGDVPARPHPAVRRLERRRAGGRHHRRHAGGDADQFVVVAAPPRQRHHAGRRQRAGHRRQQGLATS